MTSLKEFKERQIAAMERCIAYKYSEHENLLPDSSSYRKAQLAKRDALIMEIDVQKQHVTDFEDLKNFRDICKKEVIQRSKWPHIPGEAVQWEQYEK